MPPGADDPHGEIRDHKAKPHQLGGHELGHQALADEEGGTPGSHTEDRKQMARQRAVPNLFHDLLIRLLPAGVVLHRLHFD